MNSVSKQKTQLARDSRRRFLKAAAAIPAVLGLGVLPINSLNAQTSVADSVKALTFEYKLGRFFFISSEKTNFGFLLKILLMFLLSIFLLIIAFLKSALLKIPFNIFLSFTTIKL